MLGVHWQYVRALFTFIDMTRNYFFIFLLCNLYVNISNTTLSESLEYAVKSRRVVFSVRNVKSGYYLKSAQKIS